MAQLGAVGAGHSFTDIAATDGMLLDVERGRATFGAGTHLYQVAPLLAPHGLALENMGDIHRQTIAGATQTGTHSDIAKTAGACCGA